MQRTWDFEFIVPRSLKQQDALSGDEDEHPHREYPAVVICSGELVEQVHSTLTPYLKASGPRRKPLVPLGR
ncbi:hypothetical protein LXA43DRAFT_607179 [Ganoderma leucocontextum]|nr:hypothetical protein LXA43DRAFT_607179 [Ganoderma leucocontextum]